MSQPIARDVKVFVPALDFSASLEFYTALGWQLIWKADDNGLAILELAGQRFYLQNYYNKDWADNFMMHILIEDAEAWWRYASNVIKQGQYKNARVKRPEKQDYDALVTFVWDPSGVLLHFAQMLEESNDN